MTIRFMTLDEYIDQALACAACDSLEDGIFAERIPSCQEVPTFAPASPEDKGQLRFTLRDWIAARLELGHSLPVTRGIDLSKKPRHESVEAM